MITVSHRHVEVRRLRRARVVASCRSRQRGQAMVEYALALTTVAFAFIAGAQAMSGIWEAQLSAMAGAMSSESIKSKF